MTDGPSQIDAELAHALIAAQFPQWAGLPVTPVEINGWDNRTFRLGDTMSLRLPSAAGYAAQVPKEHRWLPILAPQLPLPIPAPVAMGAPATGIGYPWHWSIYRWLDGVPAAAALPSNLTAFAADLAGFLVQLQLIDATDGPAAGPHNFFRGGPLQTYDAETRAAVRVLGGRIDREKTLDIWQTALSTSWRRPPVWVHGDVSVANLLVRDQRLAAVIDFGSSGVGDPACDTVIAWTLFTGPSRQAFRATLGLDDATWARGRGWALWKCLITLAGNPEDRAAQDTLDQVLADR